MGQANLRAGPRECCGDEHLSCRALQERNNSTPSLSRKEQGSNFPAPTDLLGLVYLAVRTSMKGKMQGGVRDQVHKLLRSLCSFTVT